jgi:hypothetical protein
LKTFVLLSVTFLLVFTDGRWHYLHLILRQGFGSSNLRFLLLYGKSHKKVQICFHCSWMLQLLHLRSFVQLAEILPSLLVLYVSHKLVLIMSACSCICLSIIVAVCCMFQFSSAHASPRAVWPRLVRGAPGELLAMSLSPCSPSQSGDHAHVSSLLYIERKQKTRASFRTKNS